MIEMKVNSVRFSQVSQQFIVLLEGNTREDRRCLPIWIGPFEADSIVLKLLDTAVPRPTTHDLLSSIVRSLGASVNYILVNELQGDTFHAKINLLANKREIDIDSRPSDAIALALRVTSPIYVEESVLDKAGIFFDQETGKVMPADEPDEARESSSKVDEKEMKKLSVYRDLIEKLDLDNLGKK